MYFHRLKVGHFGTADVHNIFFLRVWLDVNHSAFDLFSFIIQILTGIHRVWKTTTANKLVETCLAINQPTNLSIY